MTRIQQGIAAVLLGLCVVLPASAKVRYRQGDWVSYSTFRYVRSIASDQRYVYFATTGGVTRYSLFDDAWANPLTTSDGLADNHVRVVAVDALFNDLWCATRGGVSRYNAGTEVWTTYTAGGGMFLDDVRSIGATEDGRLIFEAPTGATVFDTRSGTWNILNPSGLSFDQNFPSVRWYGAKSDQRYTYPTFIPDFEYIFNPPYSIQDQSFRTYRLTSFLEDAFSNVWIGTWGLNVGKASLRSLRLKILQTGLASRSVTAMASDGDLIWFGGAAGYQEPGGITRFDRRTGEWTYFEPFYTEGLHSGNISAITVDSTDAWFGTPSGVVWYDKKDRIWTTLPVQRFTSTDITALALGDSALWAGTARGINRIDRKTRAVKPVLLPALRDLHIYDIAVDTDRSVWVTSNRGVYRRRPDGVWKKIEDPHSLNLNGHVFVIEIQDDVIWFGTESSLLRFHRGDGSWDQWLLPVAAAGGALRLTVTGQTAWLGTRNGAAKFDIAQERWTVYTMQDGLLDETVQALLTDGDYIWFGTKEGVTRFFWNDPTRVE